jgi:hypothetical protein
MSGKAKHWRGCAAPDVFCSGEDLMCEMVPFQIAPDFFDVIEFGCVFWQPLDCQPVFSFGKGQ